MIVGSLLLILVAIGLIILGLALASNWLLAGAILACVVAAIFVYFGSRLSVRAIVPPAADAHEDSPHVTAPLVAVPVGHLGGSMFAGRGNPVISSDPGDEDDEAYPADEPLAQAVPPATRARLARSALEVLVVDGRPRYHLHSCAHLADLTSEPLPVSEAQALGFTPCALCEPATTLTGP